MGKKLSDAEIGRFDRQLFALRERVIKGIRPYDKVREVLQSLIEPPPMPKALASWPSLDSQLEHLLTEVPDDVPKMWFERLPAFVPHTPTAQPLLVLTLHDEYYEDEASDRRTFDVYTELIRKRLSAMGKLFVMDSTLKLGNGRWRLLPGTQRKPGLAVVSFDPLAHYNGTANCSIAKRWATGATNLAGPAVLAALAQTNYAELMLCGDLPHAAILAGYQAGTMDWRPNWTHVPYVSWLDTDHTLYLHNVPATIYSSEWASPTVKEC